jgi:transcriptional regulator with XRE-family HTH domain
MNKRLIEIIRYKTGGKQIQFAELMGWSPQYLAKLVKGENFGLQPVLSLLSTLPEINARWFLFGQGQMLDVGRLFDLQRQTLTHVMSLIDLEKYIPVMTGEEIREFEEAIKTGRKPSYNADTIYDMAKRLSDRMKGINDKFAHATAKSEELCKQKTAKK